MNKEMGVIFDIQRFSVHDGPGIRTTVFMKGCPLRCKWCHNPEGLLKAPQLQYFKELCIGCGRCKTREYLWNADHCPSKALKVCGQQMTVDEVMDIVLKDKNFYADNGGVTFSGGECLLQADFISLFLKKAKEVDIHTAIDTSGYIPWHSIEKTLDFCDLYLYDVKCITPELHEKYTGVNNSLIIENFKKLSTTGKEIWVRIPVIPTFNDNEREMTAIADLVASVDNVRRVTLMPYHSLGASKYETLGLSYEYDPNMKIENDKLEKFINLFNEKDIPVV